MEKIKKLFVDGSVNPKENIGFGAYLFCDDLNNCTKDMVVTKKFTNTSSTKLEVQTLLWAISEIDTKAKFVVYTDCQNILSLLERKKRLEGKNYFTKTGKKVRNEELYRSFFTLYEKYNFEIIKVKGHKKSSTKDDIDLLFNFVDKASRTRLRQEF
ncbi:MAG: ribonuclease HI [Campylobacterota bacterium]